LWLAAACTAFAPHARADDVDSVWKDLMVKAQHAATSQDYAQAEQTYQRAIKEAERFGAADSRVVATLTNFGALYQTEKKTADAVSMYQRAITILESGEVDENSQYADLNLKMGSLLVESGKAYDALPHFRKSLSIFSRREGGDSLSAAAAHCAYGEAYRDLRNWAEAERSLKRCAEIREGDGGIMNEALGDAVYSLALVYEKEGKYALADPRFKLAEKIREKTLGIMSPGFADVLESHAAMLKSLGRQKEASQDAALAAAIRRHQSKK
jgi:tetratricopeptide (TPR) repeat protein